jgi:hypothetical protein
MAKAPTKPRSNRGFRENPKRPIDRGAPASVIVTKFGGTNVLARALNRQSSTVHGWIVNGFIPPKYNDDVMKAAGEHGVKLKPTDFVDMRSPEERQATTTEQPAAE